MYVDLTIIAVAVAFIFFYFSKKIEKLEDKIDELNRPDRKKRADEYNKKVWDRYHAERDEIDKISKKTN